MFQRLCRYYCNSKPTKTSRAVSYITKPTNIEMLIKLLYCILIPLIKGNPFGGLVDMYEDWHESLLFIYYGQKVDLKSPGCDRFLRQGTYSNILYPDCFAFQLSFTFAYTSSSCFMNLEKIIAMILNNETQESIMERILSGDDMKSTVDKFVVYRVIHWSFS